MAEWSAFYTSDAICSQVLAFADGKIASLEIAGAPSLVFPGSVMTIPLVSVGFVIPSFPHSGGDFVLSTVT
jgi:hypothetical protein